MVSVRVAYAVVTVLLYEV